MTPDFEADRRRAIVKMWRDGVSFDVIVDYVGMALADAALIILKNMGLPWWLDRHGPTMADIMRRERRDYGRAITVKARPSLAISKERLAALLPHVTTPVLRARLLSARVATETDGNSSKRRI